jgi:hypothetical protein
VVQLVIASELTQILRLPRFLSEMLCCGFDTRLSFSLQKKRMLRHCIRNSSLSFAQQSLAELSAIFVATYCSAIAKMDSAAKSGTAATRAASIIIFALRRIACASACCPVKVTYHSHKNGRQNKGHSH